MNRLRSLTTATLCLLALLEPSRAQAKSSLHAVGSVSTGISDNALAAPSNPPAGVPGPITVLFTDLRPGALLFVESPRVLQRFRYTNSVSLFLNHSEANSYSNELAWNALFTLSRHSELVLGFGATQGRLNTLTLLQGPSSNAPNALPSGGVSFASANVQEALSHELSVTWRGVQSSSLGVYTPLGSDVTLPTSFQMDHHIGIEHLWEKDALGIQGRFAYALSTEVRTNTRITSPHAQQLITGAVLAWRHDWTPVWGSELDGGFVEIMRANDAHGQVWGWTGLAALRYTPSAGQAELSYSHTVQPNLLLAQSFLSDLVSIRGGVPLDRKGRFFATTSCGYQHGRLVDTNQGILTNTVNVALADIALGWVPAPSFTLAVRYQRFQQMGDAHDTTPLPTFKRDAGFITFTGMFPPHEDAPERYSLSSRVDQSDRHFNSSPGSSFPSDNADVPAKRRRDTDEAPSSEEPDGAGSSQQEPY